MESTQLNTTSGNSLTICTHTVQDPKGGMVERGCQDKTAEMESQGEKERGETLVCRDHLAHKVALHYTEKLLVELLLARKIPRSPLNSQPCI